MMRKSLRFSNRFTHARVYQVETLQKIGIQTYSCNNVHVNYNYNSSLNPRGSINRSKIHHHGSQEAQKHQFSSIIGKGVMSPFIKSSYLLWGIPLSALVQPYIITLPFDIFFGTLLPYHAYIGMNHVFTGECKCANKTT